MHPRTLLVLILLMTVPSPPAASGAELAALPLTVRVYDGTAMPATTRAKALAVAASTLADAGLDTLWRHCDPAGGGHRCDSAPSSDELLVRLVSRETAASTRVTLGEALIDRATGSGQLATIYVDRVRTRARATSADIAQLLGRAIAHELGHLLLSTASHGTDGLMRAMWSDAHIRRPRAGDWSFTRNEVALIRARRHSQIAWSE
jgi:hypothetical protein